MGQIDFITEYRSLATQMNGYVIAGTWARLAGALADAGRALSPAEAAAWDGLGYLPEEAGQLILDGITAAQQAEMEAHAAAQAGGQEALAALRIAELAAGSVTEDEIVRVLDPFTGAELISLREER